ncbi:10428_t:CDS:2 [Paraglomus brasilianum]|uniref:10428_t:CDS:1 n=1 Tax=Paraglomus brasilianum TaxID=144538 RepID=A0A9N9CNW9_9GLOM|nr:10428_t:CDS:2 [Paraglomus brasilianum]
MIIVELTTARESIKELALDIYFGQDVFVGAGSQDGSAQPSFIFKKLSNPPILEDVSTDTKADFTMMHDLIVVDYEKHGELVGSIVLEER